MEIDTTEIKAPNWATEIIDTQLSCPTELEFTAEEVDIINNYMLETNSQIEELIKKQGKLLSWYRDNLRKQLQTLAMNYDDRSGEIDRLYNEVLSLSKYHPDNLPKILARPIKFVVLIYCKIFK